MIESQKGNVVLVPVGLRPELFQQYWLIKNRLLGENASGIFTPVVVQCSDDDFELLVLQDRLQIHAKVNDLTQAMATSADRLRQFIQAAGSSIGPLKGAGLNCQVVITGDGAGSDFVRRTFFQERFFDGIEEGLMNMSLSFAESLQFGLVTTNINSVVHSETERHGIQVDFNCHRDVTTLDDVDNLLASANEFAQFCQRRCNQIEQRLGS